MMEGYNISDSYKNVTMQLLSGIMIS